MATYQKTPAGKWRVIIRRKGAKAQSKNFVLKKDAQAWARKVESEIERGLFIDPKHSVPLSEIFDRYLTQEVPNLKSKQDMTWRIGLLKERFGSIQLVELTPKNVAEFRDWRLKTVQSGTVLKDLLILQRILEVAWTEWGFNLPNGNPVQRVSKPKASKARDRRISIDERHSLLQELESNPLVMAIVELLLETAMRRSELVNLTWNCVDLEKRLVCVMESKNGESRDVPLSSRAVEIFRNLKRNGDRVFGITPSGVTQAFKRACKRAGIEDLRLHDCRHERISELFEWGLDIPRVAVVSGHKSWSQLQRYTNLRASDLVDEIG